MYNFLKILLGFVLIVVLAAGYLSVYHFFAFQELAALPIVIVEPTAVEPDPNITTITQFDKLVAQQFESKSINGAAVALVADGEVAWSKGYGLANVEENLVATPDTPFMIASISKVVLGVALMHAVESGAVDLDTDINEYLRFEVKNPHIVEDHAITLRHLATHTSGIRDSGWLYTNSYVYGDTIVSLEEFLRNYLMVEGEHYRPNRNFLKSRPGDVSEYSNFAAGLAAHVLEAATGSRLDAYSQTHIFAPLGMDNTGWFLADFEDISQIAQPYALANRPIPHYGYPTWPDGQLRTSANDLARLLAMVMNGGELDGVRILEEATVAAMLEKQPFQGLEATEDHGIFWSYSSRGAIGHSGGDHGVTTGMFFNPETDVGVVVLTNASVSRALESVFNIVRQVVWGESTPDIINSLP